MHRIIGIFLISLSTVSWPGGRVRWVTGDGFFFFLRGRDEAVQDTCSVMGETCCLPGRRSEGQHGGHRPPFASPLSPQRWHLVLSWCLRVRGKSSVLGMAVPGTRGSWCGAVAVAMHAEQGCWGSAPVFSPGSVSFCITSENGRAKLWPRLCRPGWLVSREPQFCELNLQAGVPVFGGSSLS